MTERLHWQPTPGAEPIPLTGTVLGGERVFEGELEVVHPATQEEIDVRPAVTPPCSGPAGRSSHWPQSGPTIRVQP